MSRRVVIAFGAALSGAAAVAPSAQAEAVAAVPTVGEVVVTATPLDANGAPLSHIPANAQTLTVDQIVQQDPPDLAHLLNENLGSVSVSDGTGNPYQNDINYRGFQATSLLGAPVSLAVYFDGVRVNEPFGAIVNWDLIPMNAVAGVDVLPGSNAIFGLNALGGALVVNTRNGQDSPGATISALGGSFGRRAASFQAGGADAASHTDYFLAGNYDQQNGFRDYSGSEVEQLFGKLRWHGPADRTVVELSGAWADTTLEGPQSLPMDMLSTPEAAYTWPDAVRDQMRPIKLQASQWLGGADQVSAQVYYRQSNAESLNSNASLDDGCFNDDGAFALAASGVAKCANQAPGGTALNAVTDAAALALGYGRWTGDINASLVTSTIRQDTVGVSGQWSDSRSVAGRKNAFILGGSFDQSSIAYRQAALLARLIDYQTVVIPNREYGFTANGLPPSAGNPPAFTGSNLLSSVTLGARVNEASVYLTDTFDLSDRFNVTAGGSWDYTSINQSGANEQDLNDDGGYVWTDDVTGVSYYNPGYVGAYGYANGGSGAASAPNGVPAGAAPGPEAESLNGAHSYQRFNPRLGFNYNLAPAIGVFGDYGESMRAPTSIELSCANPNSPCALPTGFNGDPNLKAVTARTWEFGARGRLAGTVTWNAAVYDSRLHDDIQFIAASAAYGYFFNVGDTERRGVELGAQAMLGKLSLSANYGYVQAAYRSSFTTAAGESVRSGDIIPGIPADTFKLRADYDLTPALRLGAALIAVGAQYAHGDENNSDPAGRVPGYGVVDLDAQYRIGRRLKLSLEVDNLLNQKYATYGLSRVNSIYSLALEPFRTPAPPVGAWLRITYAFGAAGGPDR